MVKYCRALVALLAALFVVILLSAPPPVFAETTVFSENFDDGNWTANPVWTTSPADPSVSISTDRCVSPPYSLRIAANASTGAIKTGSGLITASEPYTCTFNLYVESIAEEGIPFCLQDLTGRLIPIIFLLPNGKVQLTQYIGGVWTQSNVPYALTYGQWHAFKLVYDGAKIDLFLDGHTTADASVATPIPAAPSQLVIGNFGPTHTGTFYVDDLVIKAEVPAPPGRIGKIWVQFCSDTSTGGLGTGNHYNLFPVDDPAYVSPTGQAAQVFAESYRNAHRDSLGNPVKLTWYMNCGSIYSGGLTTGPIFPYELMMDHHADEIARWGDEMAYHYHTWFWDGANWTQTDEFTPCLPDFEQTVAHFILDRDFYPTSFRAGWNWMSSLWERYLDDWFPYRFEGDSPSGPWTPYHPDPNNWQAVGSLRGWEDWYDYTPGQSQAKVDAIFSNAYLGNDQVVCFWSHLKEDDFATKIDEAHNYLVNAHARYPMVDFEYVTAKESMLKWRNGTDVTPPSIIVTASDSNGIRTATFTSNEPVYQRQPFVALRKMDGTYYRLDCTPAGENRWQVSYPLADSWKVGVGVTDWFGNATVKPLPTAFQIANLKANPNTTSIDVTWETNQPSDTKVTYQVMPTGTAATTEDAALVTAHHVLLSGIQPGQVYKIDVSSTTVSSDRTANCTYVVTGLADPVVVDNSDPGFTAVGSWSTGNTAPGHYGPDYRVASASSTGTSYTDWTWQAPTAGLYRVSVWWSQGSNRCTAVTYSVITGGTEYPKIFNQQTLGATWNEHGMYYLNAGQSVTVRLYNKSSAGNMVISDATKFEPAYTSLSTLSLGRLLKDGERIALPSATVTAVFDGEYYIQGQSGIPGIKVIGSGVTEGATVQVSGVLATDANGERVITEPAVH